MAKSMEDITRSQFMAHERVRSRGRFNMLSFQARAAAGLDRETHVVIITHYEALAQKWPDVRKEAPHAWTHCDIL